MALQSTNMEPIFYRDYNVNNNLQQLGHYWFNFYQKQGIAKILLIWIVLFSSLMTIILSGIQLYIDYRIELDTIHTRLNEIEKSYKESIEASLWHVDLEQLNIQMEGLFSLPDIQMIVLEEKQDIEDAVYIIKGQSDNLTLKRHYQLFHIDGIDTSILVNCVLKWH